MKMFRVNKIKQTLRTLESCLVEDDKSRVGTSLGKLCESAVFTHTVPMVVVVCVKATRAMLCTDVCVTTAKVSIEQENERYRPQQSAMSKSGVVRTYIT